MSKSTITVYGKADHGSSPKFGAIVEGQPYTIEADDFTAQLFVKKVPKTKTEGSD